MAISHLWTAPRVALFVLTAALFSAMGLTFPSTASAQSIPSALGVELGGNGSLLFTDANVGAFGVGAGFQGSLSFTLWRDRPIALKTRLESISMKQEAIQKAATDYAIPGTLLKSMTQSWNMISFGAEGSFPRQGQTLFWEALLGYAIGGPSTISYTTPNQNSPLIDSTETTTSAFVLSGGVGLKREFTKRITGIVDVRTMFLLAPVYATGPFSGRTIIPFPLAFNVGIEVPL